MDVSEVGWTEKIGTPASDPPPLVLVAAFGLAGFSLLWVSYSLLSYPTTGPPSLPQFVSFLGQAA